MTIEAVLIYVCCAMLVGLGGWVFSHTVDRRAHLNGTKLVSEEVFRARLAALEDRLAGRIAAVNVKLDDLEKLQRYAWRILDERTKRNG